VALDALPDGALARLQEHDRVLQHEAQGLLELIVYRPAEMLSWHRAVAQGDEIAARRLAVLHAQLPDFLAGIDERQCIGCMKAFSRDSLPADLVLAHARVATVLPSAAVLGGVCPECSAAHDAAELHALFTAQLRRWYPDLRQLAPASLSSSAGQA
jgi:hypothetical protein